MASPQAKAGLLNSWKEIAVYMGRGVRTVQRWEGDSGLPVQRLGRGRRAPVFAHAKDIDDWLQRRFGSDGKLRGRLNHTVLMADLLASRNEMQLHRTEMAGRRVALHESAV